MDKRVALIIAFLLLIPMLILLEINVIAPQIDLTMEKNGSLFTRDVEPIMEYENCVDSPKSPCDIIEVYSEEDKNLLSERRAVIGPLLWIKYIIYGGVLYAGIHLWVIISRIRHSREVEKRKLHEAEAESHRIDSENRLRMEMREQFWSVIKKREAEGRPLELFEARELRTKYRIRSDENENKYLNEHLKKHGRL